jgi:hypothetical protein
MTAMAEPDPNLQPVQYGACLSASVIRYRSPTVVRKLATRESESGSDGMSGPGTCLVISGILVGSRRGFGPAFIVALLFETASRSNLLTDEKK